VKNAILTAVCFLALVACDKPASTETKPEDKNAPTTTNAVSDAAAATTTTTPAATPVTINDSDVSTPADFEESAEKAITAKNYKTELSTLEAEVAKE
jgi:hypothetical protein